MCPYLALSKANMFHSSVKAKKLHMCFVQSLGRAGRASRKPQMLLVASLRQFHIQCFICLSQDCYCSSLHSTGDGGSDTQGCTFPSTQGQAGSRTLTPELYPHCPHMMTLHVLEATGAPISLASWVMPSQEHRGAEGWQTPSCLLVSWREKLQKRCSLGPL